MKKQDQFYIPIIIILSIIIPLAVAALMFMPEEWHFDLVVLIYAHYHFFML